MGRIEVKVVEQVIIEVTDSDVRAYVGSLCVFTRVKGPLNGSGSFLEDAEGAIVDQLHAQLCAKLGLLQTGGF
jgi:hypothetical protein